MPLKTFKTPSGGTYQRMVADKTTKKGKAKAKAKAPARTKVASGQAIHHKAYSYTNKKGKSVTVAAHTEYPRGGRPAGAAKPRKAAKKTSKKRAKKQKTAIKTLK